MNPPRDGSDFKELFQRLYSTGAGRKVDTEGIPIGSWTPELLAEEITTIDKRGNGVDLRTVQLWLGDNNNGISPDSIRLLARIFGCNDPDAISAWQAELTASKLRWDAKRKARSNSVASHSKKTADEITSKPTKENIPISVVPAEMKKRSFALKLEALYTSNSALNLPAMVWTGCVFLAFLAYITGVHSVTYSPMPGLDKQVGFLWAPNWTVLELFVLPLFLFLVSQMMSFWKKAGRTTLGRADGQSELIGNWEETVTQFSASHWLSFFVCAFIVFAVQWTGVHLKAYMNGDVGTLMVDWNVISLVRPDVISVPEGIFISGMTFLYTAFICFLFLTGLLFLFTVAHDYFEVCGASDEAAENFGTPAQRSIGVRLMYSLFRCAILGIFLSTCVKLQTAYLVSDGANIFAWLGADALHALGADIEQPGSLHQRSVTHFSSFVLLFVTCTVFCFGFVQIYRVVERPLKSESPVASTAAATLIEKPDDHHVPWLKMLSVIAINAIGFVLIDQFSGFSILLVLGVLIALYGLYDPQFRGFKFKS